MKILLVEDNELNCDLIARRLKRHSLEVVIATDGEQGITLARSEAPDLILMDMSLPVLDGWSAARRLKDEEPTRAIPIIAITAHAMVGDRERALAAGCDDYHTKPGDFAELLDKIKRLVRRVRPEAQP